MSTTNYTQYACLQSNRGKFRFIYKKSYSSKKSKEVVLIDFEHDLKYVNSDCPLDVVNSKLVDKIGYGLVSVNITDEAQGEVILSIGKNKLALKKENITNEDMLQEQLYLSEKKVERIEKENERKSMEIQSLKAQNEKSAIDISEAFEQIDLLRTLLRELNFNTAIVEQSTPVTIGKSFPGSKILSDLQATFLNKEFGNSHQRWTLAHQGTVHGFGVTAIHPSILHRGPFIVIVKSTNNCIFGGFNSVGLKGGAAYRHAPGSFLFSLTRQNGVEDYKRLEVIIGKEANAIHDAGHPSIFGAGHDLYIADNSNANTTSTSVLGNTYTSGDGTSTFFMGANNYQVSELEYYIPNTKRYQ